MFTTTEHNQDMPAELIDAIQVMLAEDDFHQALCSGWQTVPLDDRCLFYKEVRAMMLNIDRNWTDLIAQDDYRQGIIEIYRKYRSAIQVTEQER